MLRTKILTSLVSNTEPCYKDKIIEQRQNVPSEWLVRKILGPNYSDGDGDNNPLTNPKLDRGEWIVFRYSDTTCSARRLPSTVQGGPFTTLVSSTGCQGSYVFEDVYLASIHTPLGRVQYEYSGGRRDDAWFKINDYNWSWNDTRDPDVDDWDDPAYELGPAADQITAIGTPAPVNRKVLDHVDFYNGSNSAEPWRRVVLQTSYTLRPHSFYSMRRNSSTTGNKWDPINQNPQGKCLTLDAIRIHDYSRTNMTETKFFYDPNNNPNGLDPAIKSDVPTIPQPMWFTPEPRDAFGFYKPFGSYTYHLLNGSDVDRWRNNYNFRGLRRKTMELHTDMQPDKPFSSAWSMTSMLLPSGMRISWEYESNRYDKCNNIDVSVTDQYYSDPAYFQTPRFGGGPRVKKVIVDACETSPTTTVSYFYTSDDKFVENNTNSSGHATIEPVPYLRDSEDPHPEIQDPRSPKTRGSFYTPAKVCYEKVKVVKNYHYPSAIKPDGQAPFGFSEYEFYTPADYPNGGMYGQIDESWRWGMMKRITQYNSNKIPVHRTGHSYLCIPNTSSMSRNFTYLTGGTIRTTYDTDTLNNVASKVTYKYAPEVQNADPDRVYNKQCDVYCYASQEYTPYNKKHFSDDHVDMQQSEGFSAIRSFVGNPLYDDMVTVAHTGTGNPHVDRGDRIDLVIIADYNNPYRNPAASGKINIANSTWHDHDDGHFMSDIQIKFCDNNGATDVYVCYKIESLQYNRKISNIQISDDGVLTHNPLTWAVPCGGNTNYYTPKLFNVAFTYHDDMQNDQDAMGESPKPEEILINCGYSFTDDRDGRPNQTITTNSDGRSLITEIIPAFTQTPYSTEMLAKNLLTPVCQTTRFGKVWGNSTVPYVVSAQAITWSKTLGSPAWVPSATFDWKAGFRSDRTPDRTFAYYNHFAGANNTNWQYKGAVTRCNADGSVWVTEAPTSISGKFQRSSTILGHGHAVPIGSIINADYQECGVFTCDYDQGKLLGPATYLDEDGGWEKGWDWNVQHATSNKISNNQPHFGQKSLLLQNGDAGIIRVSKVRGNTTYKFSSWVKVENGSARLYADYFTGPETAPTWPVHWQAGYTQLAQSQTEVTIYKETSGSGWKFVELTIPVNAGNSWYIRTRIGGEGSYKAYVDDIRFAPANGQIKTTYYDTLWRRPIIAIGEDNNPGQLSTFDDYGRLSGVFTLNKNMGANETGAKTPVQTYEYNITGNCLRPYGPSPEDGTTKVRLKDVRLEWKCDIPLNRTIDHYDVYIGTDRNNLIKQNPYIPVVTTQFDITNIQFNTPYFWRIVVHLDDGTIINGPIWTFTRMVLPMSIWLKPDQWRDAMRCKGQCNDAWFWWRPCVQTSPNGLEMEYKIEYNGSYSNSYPIPSCTDNRGVPSCVSTMITVGKDQGVYNVILIAFDRDQLNNKIPMDTYILYDGGNGQIPAYPYDCNDPNAWGCRYESGYETP
jgi:hypothetical protein